MQSPAPFLSCAAFDLSSGTVQTADICENARLREEGGEGDRAIAQRHKTTPRASSRLRGQSRRDVKSAEAAWREQLCGACSAARALLTAGPCFSLSPVQDYIKQGEPEWKRCDTEAKLKQSFCNETNIIFPSSHHILLANKPLSTNRRHQDQNNVRREPVQVQPQEVQLLLRPGLQHSFQIRFRLAEDYPVDLYYLMDLSYSMNDDLNNVKRLGNSLLRTLRQITSRARIGFGSFVDKTVLPFTNTNPDRLKKPCPEKENQCQPAFGFKHVLSLTENGDEFNHEVAAQNISGNLDQPEGSLDAIMQSVVCGVGVLNIPYTDCGLSCKSQDKIGWGNSTRLLVLTTDAGFHMAGDGKLGSIFEPNDGKCHLDESLTYSKNNEMDYPSVGQVANKLAENNIQAIFAVTKNVEPVYTASVAGLVVELPRNNRLKEIIPKSEVGVLSNDSSNVVELIKGAYNKLSSNVILSHDELPEGITVHYTSDCDGGHTPSPRGICNNVGIGKEVVFTVTVTALECMEKKTFNIGPLGFREKTKVNVETRCQCECDDDLSADKKRCSGHGRINCGACSCDLGYMGHKCDCKVGDKDETHLKEACRPDNMTAECSGQGECTCGQCMCHSGADGRIIYGQYCNCNDRDCEVHNNKLCGGNGKCRCNVCICDTGYEGSACQCKISTQACRKGDGSVCSNRGKCECNSCHCQGGYKPPLCETCPGCPSPCPAAASCIECLGFEKGPLRKNCTQSCGHIQHKTVANLTAKKPCRERDSEGCWMVFTMNELNGFDNYGVVILDKRG
ncbi:integrin beta-2-like [Scleropages formosus]|uniref:Integrin beta n=1 Tax=Scleropages formosus TaxID=113540 RepID=A0A0P7WDP7_SCLFO|nr:integrin beta-2-like [Scleropages formosus]